MGLDQQPCFRLRATGEGFLRQPVPADAGVRAKGRAPEVQRAGFFRQNLHDGPMAGQPGAHAQVYVRCGVSGYGHSQPEPAVAVQLQGEHVPAKLGEIPGF